MRLEVPSSDQIRKALVIIEYICLYNGICDKAPQPYLVWNDINQIFKWGMSDWISDDDKFLIKISLIKY